MTSLVRFDSWPQVWEASLTAASYLPNHQSVDFVTAYSSLLIQLSLSQKPGPLSYIKQGQKSS